MRLPRLPISCAARGPYVPTFAAALVAEGYKFKSSSGRIREAGLRGCGENFIEIVLDSTVDPPRVTGQRVVPRTPRRRVNAQSPGAALRLPPRMCWISRRGIAAFVAR